MNQPNRLAKMEIGVGHHVMGALCRDLCSPSSPSLDLAILLICSNRNCWQSWRWCRDLAMAMANTWRDDGCGKLREQIWWFWRSWVGGRDWLFVVQQRLPRWRRGHQRLKRIWQPNQEEPPSLGYQLWVDFRDGEIGAGICDIGPKQGTCRHISSFLRWANITR